jgi:cytochrome c heme-lyase
MGRPDELSPKARFKMLFSHPAPFDRHDWTVDRGGKEVRYIIDYYHDESAIENDQRPQHLKDISSMQSIKVDVRPALDSIESVLDRLFNMPMQTFVSTTVYSPPSFFPPAQMKLAEETKGLRVMKNWEDIKSQCAIKKEKLTTCQGEEACGAASVALQRCISGVVCPSVATDFDVCVQAKPHNDTKTGAAFASMIKCIDLFEMDTKQLQQQKVLAKSS